jgi:phospholipid transport system substrate-binding protein
MRSIFVPLSLCFITLASLSLLAPARAATPAEAFISTVTTEALNILRTSTSAEDREQQFGSLLDNFTNMRRIARFTLGASARTISEQDLNNFELTLRDTLVRIYANRLAGYTDERIEISGSTTKGRNHLVTSRILFSGDRPAVDMVWWVIQEKDGRFTLFDIQILGVWMAQEQRDVFSGILKSNQGSIKSLIQHLEKQVREEARRANDEELASN